MGDRLAISAGLLQAPLNPLKTNVSRGPPGLSGGPGPLGLHRNSTTGYSAQPGCCRVHGRSNEERARRTAGGLRLAADDHPLGTTGSLQRQQRSALLGQIPPPRPALPHPRLCHRQQPHSEVKQETRLSLTNRATRFTQT